MDKIEKLGGVPWGVNDWGSCQYTGALNMYRALKKTNVSTSSEKIPLAYSHKGMRKLPTAYKAFKRDVIAQIKEIEKDDKAYAKKRIAEIEKDLKGKPSIEKMFKCLKHQAWDLWSAAPFVAHHVFKNLELSTQTAPGRGPIGNILVQGSNYTTGAYCWLLYSEGLVKDETCFAGFDT